MERRDFLAGTLVGLGTGAGAMLLADPLHEEPPEPPECPEPPPVEPAPKDDMVDPAIASRCYAEHGEDVAIRGIFKKLRVDKPTYLDVGAYHPRVGNMTYLLYTEGARGVLVEPNPYMVKLLREDRPEDKVLGVGVGTGEAEKADYYIIRNDPRLNTFSKEQADRYVELGGKDVIERVVEMPLVSVSKIMEEHLGGAPDLLSLDIEGLDLAVLKTIDFERHRSLVLCVETVVFNTSQMVGGIIDFLASKDYVVRGGSFVNTIFMDARRLRSRVPEGARIGVCP